MHGYLDSAATFDRLAPILVQQSHYNIRIVAFDFSGQGKSSHRADHTNYFISWVSEGKAWPQWYQTTEKLINNDLGSCHCC